MPLKLNKLTENNMHVK